MFLNPLSFLGFLIFQISAVLATPLPLSSPVDYRPYNPDNPFFKIIQNPSKALKTPLYVDAPHSLSFGDKNKKVKEHILVIPKGPYLSFPHFLDFASDAEIEDLMRTVAKTAKLKGLDKTGYRLVTNHSLHPGQKGGQNNAHQEIPHFHIHLVGGECLGEPVVGSFDSHINRRSIDMTYDGKPDGAGFSSKEFIDRAIKNKIEERRLKRKDGKELIFLAYNIPEAKSHKLKDYVGFLILDDKRNSMFTSIQDFAQRATVDEMRELFTFIKDTSEKDGSYSTGFRLLSDVGADAHQTPSDVFQMTLAGGNLLGVTVANVYGNHRVIKDSQGSEVDKSHFYYYKDLSDMPHEHCAS